MSRPLLRTLVLGLIAFGLHACGGPRSESGDVATASSKLLEPDLHFALSMAGYEPRRLLHDSDLFSNWGDLLLVYAGKGQPIRAVVAQHLLAGAIRTGWERESAGDDEVYLISDLGTYGLVDKKEDFDLAKRSGPERRRDSRCKLWISEAADRILIAYRFDSN